ncbi:MAG: hypothetical protein NTX61_10170 [Bacteroidetes bacterium]|nr:hypothetical protein [Bacteroidota bacterium]
MLFIALPVLNEGEFLPRFMSCLSNQTCREFRLFVCVNQPDKWWTDPVKVDICRNNVSAINYLENIRDTDIVIIDRCTPGNGWKGRKHGVGWARKTVMDAINVIANSTDIIISLDADTTFNENYFESVVENFRKHSDGVALAVPYFHKPVQDEGTYRAILRYEIYMRHYVLNLWRIRSPYTFTALGSATACPVWAYRAIGGMTPKMSGEDFYFLQKLRKFGRVLFWNSEKVYPEARFSDRVYFGTGPAMIKGNNGDWSSYPFYSTEFFDEILETYRMFPSFYLKTTSTRVSDFLCGIFGEKDPFAPLRSNARTVEQFIRACHEKFDGLRILQYLKKRQIQQPEEDETSLHRFLRRFYSPEELIEIKDALESLSFRNGRLEELEKIRTFLMKKEEEYQVNSIRC